MVALSTENFGTTKSRSASAYDSGYQPSEWTTESIAALSPSEIANMPAVELIELMCSVPLPFATRSGHERFCERLQYLNRATLERLAHLVRRSCRNQTRVWW